MSFPAPARIALVFILLISLPYVSAFLLAGSGASFGGFLLNPQDGNSYLAKMYQGWRGDWQFRLPYSATPGEGAYLYTFYLALGHLARGLGLPLLAVYHLARLAAAGILAWVLWRFFKSLHLDEESLVFGFGLAILGLGLGWLAFPFGAVTSDFWVAEAYPFLSAYTNPHFSLSLAFMLWLLLPVIESSSPGKMKVGKGWGMAALTVLVAAWMTSMSPFALVLVLGILGGLFVWEAAVRGLAARQEDQPVEAGELQERPSGDDRGLLWQSLWVALGGLPVALNATLSIRRDEVLSAWNAQNLTLTPPAWDLILAFSPALLLAAPGAWWAIRSGGRSGRLLVVWAGLALLLAYLPFDLQRRFLAGVYVPLAALATFGLVGLAKGSDKVLKRARRVVLALALPTTLLALLVGQFGALRRDPLLYLDKSEQRALEWIEANTPEDALVLADARMGLFIPAHTGRRVIYGHEFETIHAGEEKAVLDEFFSDLQTDPQAARKLLDERRVDYVLFLPDDLHPGGFASLPGTERVYEAGDASIYRMMRP